MELQNAVLFGSDQYDLTSALLDEPLIQRMQLEDGCAIEGAEADSIATEAFIDYFGRTSTAEQAAFAKAGVTDWYSACENDLDGLMTSGAHSATQVCRSYQSICWDTAWEYLACIPKPRRTQCLND